MPELAFFLPNPAPASINRLEYRYHASVQIRSDSDMSKALVEIVRRYTDVQAGGSPFATAIKGLTILRSDHEKHPSHLIFKPALCVVVQGAKWTTFGDSRFDYRAGKALVVSVEMPAFSRVTEASPTDPYLGVVIEFDLAMMSEVMEGLDIPPRPAGNVGRGVFVTDFDGPLADCVLRMVRLLDTPKAIPMLSPMVMREICYWLLTGPHGGEVSKIVLANSHAQRVIKAIYALRDQFTETVRIEDLAAIAQLSPSAFHRQFKALTSMTPLQYQKQLRLLEARHLLVAGDANAETAAFQVGYESPSQFSREYARMFGAPPRRDIAALRTVST
jgi:AraC-like DNA-binding protein